MIESLFLQKSIIAILLGFLVGLERNISFNSSSKSFAGSRTFALISLIGLLSVHINQYFQYFIYISFLSIVLISSIAYILKVYKHFKHGSTTNISAILVFIIGVLVGLDKIEIAISATTILVVILHLKTKIQKIETKLSSKEINAAILLLIMSFLILPYLPDKMIFYINPYKTWLMAIIIALLSFIGYLGIKFFGEKYGVLITGAAGGFISSTAVTYSITKLYKAESKTYIYVAAIGVANSIMFARVFIETSLINKELSQLIAIPFILTATTGILYSYLLYKKSSTNINYEIKQTNPLELQEAIKFAIIFAIIYSTTFYLHNRLGEIGIYIVSFISGLTDVDAITLSLSSLSKNSIQPHIAAIGIAIASISNTLFKLGIVIIFGNKNLYKETIIFFGIILSVFIISFGVILLLA